VSNRKIYAKTWLHQVNREIGSSEREKLSILLILGLTCFFASAQRQCDDIKLNQVGYYPNSSKLAFITSSVRSDDFYIVSADGTDTVYQGTLGNKRKSAYSSTVTRVADFSLFTASGNYVLRIDDRQSFPFEIRSDVYTDLGKAVLKSFYYQRSSIPIEEKYAGKWSRNAKHSGDEVLVHPSSYSDDRGSVISSPGGWYNKGDLDKCVVTNGVTTSTLLSAYEDFTNYFDTLNTDIPESHDNIPDLLNEILFNVRWMFTMQDPFDGGVYHRCVNMKSNDATLNGSTEKAEVYKKSTRAALDFAAVMAQAGRVFKKMKWPLPGLSDSCLRASANAWFWALKYPNVPYNDNGSDKNYRSVAYTNSEQLNDEWIWAATEMFATSKNQMYFDVVAQNMDDSSGLSLLPGNVKMLAYYTMLRYQDILPAYTREVINLMRRRVLKIADEYIAHIASNAFLTVMGQSKNDFTMASNAVAASQGILLINAYLITGNDKYVSASMTNLDYLLGRNATGYCFVTGCFGIKSPLHPYYRLSDGYSEPVPGLLVAGPCGGREKSHFSTSSDIETSYNDDNAFSETNRISIDWNSSMVYLVNAVQAMQYELGFSPKTTSTIAVNR